MCSHMHTFIRSPMLCEWLLYCSCGRHSDTIICSPILCEWLLYCSCYVTSMQLNTSYKILPLHSCNYGLCTAAVTLSHTSFCSVTVRAVCMYLTAKFIFFSAGLSYFPLLKQHTDFCPICELIICAIFLLNTT